MALASAPTLVRGTQSHVQLAKDTVRVTMYGLRNQAAMDFLDAFYSYCGDSGVLGVMNVPTIRDEKRTQAELRTLAQKKSVEFEVAYLQGTMRKVARQVLRAAAPRLYVDDEFVSGPRPSASPAESV
jgi:hypothetical protein